MDKRRERGLASPEWPGVARGKVGGGMGAGSA